MEYADILHRCFRCGYCKLPSDYTDLTCPSYLNFRFETFSPGGRLWLLRAWLAGEIATSPRLEEILFSCAACGNCLKHCIFPKFKDDVLEAILAGRRELVTEGAVPPTVRDYLKAVHISGNPYKQPAEARTAWADGLGLEKYQGQEYLFFVGDEGAFDDRSRRMSRAVASLLQDLGLSIGLLGSEESSDGNEVRTIGESGLFELLARQNIDRLNAAGVRKIITLSPHAYHAFKKEYIKFGANFEVFHYSQVLARFVKKAGWSLDSTPATVTFHDPCYLGRHNEEYRAPRTIIAALPGLRLVEMDRSRQNALCCGGGGGNFYTEILGRGPDSPARVRVKEAVGTGATILAVACPVCVKMLEDAVKIEELESKLKVMDLAELIRHRRT